MRHTFHCSDGRGLETTTCCCTLEHCGLFYSVLLAFFSIFSLAITLFAPGESIGPVARMCLCSFLSISLLFSIVSPIGIYRRSSCFLSPLIGIIILLLALCITTVIATVLYAIVVQEKIWDEMTSTVDAVFQSGLINPIVVSLFDYQAHTKLPTFEYAIILSMGLLLLISFHIILIHSLYVMGLLWRRFFSKSCDSDAASMDWMFINLNGSYSTTIEERGRPSTKPKCEEGEWRRNPLISLSDGLDSTY
ncbi:hypothetical protein PRIPAC_71035 [Pristionchus pacificus]|uniref:Uncharacterized protein n=1 Tax=Pristionchus pacificus TaxID=54126 RepID=A0A2A6BF38_PRIPA|nr:hypothetical protein PRIPAC_71035 [Pristionchus pacificus]|eukprot:PDM64476.1 hypothetical protein PRIPAC_52732 [Pristionchus pacificus]